MDENGVSKVFDFCKNNLDIEYSKLGNEYYYQSLPLCIIDAVFSMGIRYETTQRVVQRYCNYFNLQQFRTPRNEIPKTSEQQSVTDFLNLENQYDFTRDIFCNKNRTSPKNGILKSEAVFKFAGVLMKHGINFFQDVEKIYDNNSILYEIEKIPGQSSGKSFKYFLMLAGNDNLIKPDRHIISFLEKILHDYNITEQCAQNIIEKVCILFKNDNIDISVRTLDNFIWKYQRTQNSI